MMSSGIRRSHENLRGAQMGYRTRSAQRWDKPDPENELYPTAIYGCKFTRQGRNGEREDTVDDNGDDDTLERNAFILNLERQRTGEDETDANGKKANDVKTQTEYFEAIQQSLFRDDIRQNSSSRILTAANNNHYPRFDSALLPSSAQCDDVFKSIKNHQENFTPANTAVVGHGQETHPRTRAVDALNTMCKCKEHRPTPAQETVLRTFGEYFDACDNNPTRVIPAPRVFLEGAAGTGKSFTFSCLEILATAINRPIAPTALTGVACTAIKTTTVRAETTASKFMYGIKPALASIRLTDKQRLKFRLRWNNAILVIVDEISFAASNVINAVHLRLQDFMNSNDLFGGVAIIFAGRLFCHNCFVCLCLVVTLDYLFSCLLQETFINFLQSVTIPYTSIVFGPTSREIYRLVLICLYNAVKWN